MDDSYIRKMLAKKHRIATGVYIGEDDPIIDRMLNKQNPRPIYGNKESKVYNA